MDSFSSFNLSKEIVNALKKEGYLNPSPVQSRVIPKALSGNSLLCQSETGSGKTHSYLVPIIDQSDFRLDKLQSIIICPSRELARQVYDFAVVFKKYFPLFRVRLFTSESDTSSNIEGTSKSPHMVIGTPGRLKDLLSSSYILNLHSVKFFVLDEADMLMENGYFEDIDEIYSLLDKKVQTMVFSATLTLSLKQHLEKYIESSFLYEGEKNKTAGKVKHYFVNVKHIGKLEALDLFLKEKSPYLCLVFASKKEDVNKAYAYLRDLDYQVTKFSGELETRERKKIIRLIKENRFQVIVCSDLLSRGIDIEDVSDVISLDLPSDLSYYYHRAGRTGRFGKEGNSYVFYNIDETKKVKSLLENGLSVSYLTLKGGKFVDDPLGLKEKYTSPRKKAFSEEEAKEVKIAKARTSSNVVKPGYKKKQKKAIDRVKNKYRRKAISKSINKHRKKED